MREKYQKQMQLRAPAPGHAKAEDLTAIKRILDANPTILDYVLQDLNGDRARQETGARGMTAEQVLRAALIKKMFEFSYEELAFHIADSVSLRAFMGMGCAGKSFKKSALAKNIKMISAKSWEQINRELMGWAGEKKIEKGRQVRIDCTVVESNIHQPKDSSLLYDSVRVLCRILDRINGQLGRFAFSDHRRRAKRRMLQILNAKGDKQRKDAYRDLLKVTHKVVGYAERAIGQLNNALELEASAVAMELGGYVKLSKQVIHQTECRVLRGERVPAGEKVVSIFEPHTDIIVKDRRDTFYGHKVCLSVGASQLITDCLITDGNPADTELTVTMLDRQKQIYGRYPLKAALDGGFASKDNLKAAKDRQIKDVCFAKKRGLRVAEMCRSQWVYNRLRRFRAGIESVISWIKRSFGFDRCSWKGLCSFGSYVWLTVVTANLRTLARAQTG
jgi:IS5 family transposase